MTYSVVAITSINEVPGQVRSFAASLGWTAADVSATEATVRHPTYTGAATFTVRADLTGAGATRWEEIELLTDITGGTSAQCVSPKLNPNQINDASEVVVSQPTKLHLFGELAGDASDPGASWIAGVIEYGYNLYRHFYLGYPEKLSSYTGGEIITGSGTYQTGIRSQYDFDEYVSKFPFSATGYSSGSQGTNGGMRLIHANNAETWRRFYFGSGGSDFDAETSTEGHRVVIGGYRDSINAGYLHAGKSPYAGAQVLVPINLYIGYRASGQQFFQAVGRPPGARMVHMEDLDPDQVITLGTETWRVYPVFRKTSTDAYPDLYNAIGTTSNAFPPYNTSQYVGLAYRVS